MVSSSRSLNKGIYRPRLQNLLVLYAQIWHTDTQESAIVAYRRQRFGSPES